MGPPAPGGIELPQGMGRHKLTGLATAGSCFAITRPLGCQNIDAEETRSGPRLDPARKAVEHA
jgi:hypothetical protein